MTDHEDSPPNVPADPVPEEIQNLQERKTLPPMEVVDARMVALSLSSMATTLEQIQASVSAVPELARSVRALDLQYESLARGINEAKGASNLAGSIASRALEEVQETKDLIRYANAKLDRVEDAVGRIAQSVQGLVEANRSIYPAVFPEREPPSDPSLDLADIIPINRSHGE